MLRSQKQFHAVGPAVGRANGRPFSAWDQDELRRQMDIVAAKERVRQQQNKKGISDRHRTPRTVTEYIADDVKRVVRKLGVATLADIHRELPDLPKTIIGAALKNLACRGSVYSDQPAGTRNRQWRARKNDNVITKYRDVMTRMKRATVAEIAEQIGRQPKAISEQLRQFEASGMVKRRPGGTRPGGGRYGDIWSWVAT